MEIDKLIEKITEEVTNKLSAEIRSKVGSTVGYGSSCNVDIASAIDHTLLKPEATIEDVKKICREAKENRFATVCVAPWYVSLASEQLRGCGVKVCTVAGFPYGAASTKAKIAETKEAIENGAQEIDMYINTSALKSGDFDSVKNDIEAVVSAASGKAKVKVVIEPSLMTDEEKVKACTIAKLVGADFIKISTFLGTGKASVEEIKLIRKIVGPSMGIKADGGIKDYETAAAIINAGANRIGASSSVAIVNNCSTVGKRKVTVRDIAKMIDHSLLRPDMSIEEILNGCKIAKEYDVASVCVKPSEVDIVARELKGTDVLVSTVIGFPHGSSTTEAKVFEAYEAMKGGCVELDMVLNIGRLVSRDFAYVEKDIKAVVDACHSKGAIVKVILENAYLTDELKEIACKICDKVGADFVKTSTGYAKSGATIADLTLMRKNTSSRVRVKAAGGVRTLDNALSIRAVGTVRFGATATKVILDEAAKRVEMGTLFEVDASTELKSGY